MLLHAITHLVLSQAPSADDSNPLGWVFQMFGWAIQQFQQKNYMPACSGLLMLLIGFAQKFELTRLPKKIVPWATVALGVVSSILMNLSAMVGHVKPHDWLTAILMGMTVGTGASGLWELVGQRYLGKWLGSSQTDPNQGPK